MRARQALLIVLATALTAILATVTSTAAVAEGPRIGVQAANEVYIQNADGRWEHFWVHNTNRQLFHRWERTAGGSLDWSNSASLGGTLLYDQIDVGQNADGRLEVLWQLSSGGWSGWAGLGGGFNGPPTVGYTSYGGIIVYAIGLDNQRWRRHQTAPSCCWSSGWVRG
jgi:hypothetical protein